jgi:hypothetical protein
VELSDQKGQSYAAAKLRAAWLPEPLAQIDPFWELPDARRMLALQSALFMIGYQPLAMRN